MLCGFERGLAGGLPIVQTAGQKPMTWLKIRAGVLLNEGQEALSQLNNWPTTLRSLLHNLHIDPYCMSVLLFNGGGGEGIGLRDYH